MKRYIRASLDKYHYRDYSGEGYYIPRNEYNKIKDEVASFLLDNEGWELDDEDADGVGIYLKEGYDLGINFDIWDEYDWAYFISDNFGGDPDSIARNINSGRYKTYLRELETSSYIEPGYVKAFKDYIDSMSAYFAGQAEKRKLEKETKEQEKLAKQQFLDSLIYINTDLPRDQVVDAYVEVLKEKYPIIEETLLNWNKSDIYYYLKSKTTNRKKDNNKTIWKLVDSIHRRYYELCDKNTPVLGVWYYGNGNKNPQYVAILDASDNKYTCLGFVLNDYGRRGINIRDLGKSDAETQVSSLDDLEGALRDPYNSKFKTFKIRKDLLSIDAKNPITDLDALFEKFKDYYIDGYNYYIKYFYGWYLIGYIGDKEVFKVTQCSGGRIHDYKNVNLRVSEIGDFADIDSEWHKNREVTKAVAEQCPNYTDCTSFEFGMSGTGYSKRVSAKEFWEQDDDYFADMILSQYDKDKFGEY